MPMIRILLIIIFSGVIISSSVAWGEGAPPGHYYKIKIDNLNYSPNALKIKIGSTVEWENADIVPHTATSKDSKFDSGLIASGAIWKKDFKVKGTFLYSCLLHPQMVGSIAVE